MAGSAAAAAPFSSRRGSTYGRNIRSTASRILVVEEEEEEEPPSSSSFSNAHPGRPFFTAMAMARAHVAALYRVRSSLFQWFGSDQLGVFSLFVLAHPLIVATCGSES